MNRTLLGSTLLVVLAAALAAYVTIVRPIEATIADRYAAIERVRAELARDARLGERLPVLERERNSLKARLARVHLGHSRAATVDRFIRALAQTVRHDAVTVQTVASDARRQSEVSLDVSIRGSYADVIRAMRELDTADVAARIDVASLGSAERRAGMPPRLSAAFHVTLLQESDDPHSHAPHPV